MLIRVSKSSIRVSKRHPDTPLAKGLEAWWAEIPNFLIFQEFWIFFFWRTRKEFRKTGNKNFLKLSPKLIWHSSLFFLHYSSWASASKLQNPRNLGGGGHYPLPLEPPWTLVEMFVLLRNLIYWIVKWFCSEPPCSISGWAIKKKKPNLVIMSDFDYFLDSAILSSPGGVFIISFLV